MSYEERNLRRQKVRYNDDNDDAPLTYQLVAKGAKVTPTSGTLAIYAPGNSTAIVAAGTAMTLSGSLLTYEPDTTTVASWPIATGYRADVVVTYGGDTYERQIVFDVVRFILDIGVGRDQLLARDDRILQGEHGGDEDLSPLIEACRDELQLKLESKAHVDGQVIENMILDPSRVAIAARPYIIEAFLREKGMIEEADAMEDKFRELWSDFLSAIKYDKDQDGEEETVGGLIQQRLVT